MSIEKRAWIYTRIDAPEDSHGCLKAQEKSLMDYAEQMGFVTIGASSDLGSGISLDRPGLTRAVEAATAGKFDILLVKSMSRIGRDAFAVQELLTRLEGCDVAVYSPLDGHMEPSFFHNPIAPNLEMQ